jgi:glycosyltransferase involved in cell wall biosynthesis
MKVLFVLQSLKKAGAERLVVNICNELVKNNSFEVAIFLFKIINEFSDELDKRVLIAGGEIQINFSLYKKDKILNYKYIDFVNEFKPDIIHSHLHHADILAHSFHYDKASYISHLHNSVIREYDGFKLFDISKKEMWANYYEYKWIIKRFKKFKTSFIACSNGALILHQKRIKLGKIILMLNASPIKNISIEYKEINEPFNLVWVGRLTGTKRPQLAIKIASVLKDRNVKYNLKILGDGDEMEECVSLINEMNLKNEVELAGFVNMPETYLKDAHLLIHTASYEGLPMIFMESNSWCLPIISTDCMPNNEYIQNGINGLIVKSEDEVLIADEIIKILKNPALYSQMSKYSYKHAKKFDISFYVKDLIEFYNLVKSINF